MSTIPQSIVASFAEETGLNKADTSKLLVSVYRDGLGKTGRRFPAVSRHHLLRIAEMFREREIPVPHDINTRRFVSNNIIWRVKEPDVLETFDVVVRSSTNHTFKFRINLRVQDVAYGIGTSPYEPDVFAEQVRNDTTLRMYVCKHIQGVATRYLERTLEGNQEIPMFMKQHVATVARQIMCTRILYPAVNLIPRLLPYNQDDGWVISIDATFAYVFELQADYSGAGRADQTIKIEDNPGLMTIGSALEKDLYDIAATLQEDGQTDHFEFRKVAQEVRTAISPALRRKVQQEIVDEGPPTALEEQQFSLGEGDEKVNVKVHEVMPNPYRIQHVQAISLKEGVAKAVSFWKAHTTLIKPSLTEIANSAIKLFGDEAPKRQDVDVIVDLALNRLADVATRNKDKYNDVFGVDESVAALGELLKETVKKKLH